MRRIVAVMLFVFVARVAFAQTREAVSPGPSDAIHATATESHPILDEDAYWPPIMLILIAMMFLSAAVIGPIVRLNMPEEIPPAHSHDEPPGTSHHHGASGTLNPAPDAELHLDD